MIVAGADLYKCGSGLAENILKVGIDMIKQGETQQIKNTREATQMLVINALFIALTFLATWLINVRIPFLPGNGGLIHLGNVPVFIAAIVYGRKTGAVSAAVGMSLFDLMSGWTAWAPFTFVIGGAMGFAVGYIVDKLHYHKMVVNIIALAVAMVIKVTGYYFAEVILYGNWIVPFGSIPGDITQVVVAGMIVLPIVERIKKYANR